MMLKVVIEDQTFKLGVEQDFLDQAEDFFLKMDADMDKGWQMGRDWIEKPSAQQKLVIVADKLLTAIENDDSRIGMMMAGYIKSRAPAVEMIEMDITGEMGHDFRETEISQAAAASSTASVTASQKRTGLDKLSAMQLAGKEVSRVFKAGKQYKFSLFNPTSGQWEESPAIADKDEAERLREFAFKKRFDELSGD